MTFLAILCYTGRDVLGLIIFTSLVKERTLFMTTSNTSFIRESIMRNGRKCVGQYKYSRKKEEERNCSWFYRQLMLLAKHDYLRYGQKCGYWKDTPKEIVYGVIPPVSIEFYREHGFYVNSSELAYGMVFLTPYDSRSLPFVQVYNATLRSIIQHYHKEKLQEERNNNKKFKRIVKSLKKEILKHLEEEDYQIKYCSKGSVNSLKDFCEIRICLSDIFLPQDNAGWIIHKLEQYLQEVIPEMDDFSLYDRADGTHITLVVRVD